MDQMSLFLRIGFDEDVLVHGLFLLESKSNRFIDY